MLVPPVLLMCTKINLYLSEIILLVNSERRRHKRPSRKSSLQREDVLEDDEVRDDREERIHQRPGHPEIRPSWLYLDFLEDQGPEERTERDQLPNPLYDRHAYGVEEAHRPAR